MKISESKEKELKLASGTVKASRIGIKQVKQHLNTLNMGNEPDEPDPEDGEDAACVDPRNFMSRKEAAMWDRLSDREKDYYKEKGLEAAERAEKTGGGISGAAFQNPDGDYADSGQDTVHFRPGYAGSTGYAPAADLRRGQAGTWRNGKPYRTAAGNHPGNARTEDAAYSAAPGTAMADMSGMAAPQGTGTDTAGMAAPQGTGTNTPGMAAPQDAGMNTAGTATGNMAGTVPSGNTAAGAAGAAAGTGAGLAAAAGKKAAEKFKETVNARMAANQSVQQKTEGGQKDNPLPDSPVVKGVTAVTAAVFSTVATVVQAAVSFLTSVLAPVIAIAAAIAVIVSLVGMLISLLLSIVSDTGNENGAERMVQTALIEEGTTDGSKYWEFVMGTEFVDGDATPWCACFVSWCAEECGYIDSGIIPKSASVAAYRTFFQQRNLYREPDGYTPKQGDLILFGSDEHIGIVQYTEGNRVVTIEGNAPDVVHSWSYTLGSPSITGYCTPQYPQDGDFSGNTNAEIAYNYLRSQGCSREAAAGIVANLQAESGIDPNCRQYGGGPGRGICQWEEGGGRFEALKDRAEAEGKQWNDLEVQLKFMWYEFTGGDSTCTYILNRDYGGIENFKNTIDLAWAVEAFERSFERAGSPMLERRIAYAREFYEQFAE